ncbi:MAG: DNA recombination protein RmuC [Candidatus Pacebacteria bacterium]|nr:DNA recombination protein RmuC [Candidatus Paceibacterota bacterium]
MEIALLIIGILILVALGVAAYFLSQLNQNKEDGAGMQLMQQELQDIRRTLDTKIGESARDMRESLKTQLGESTRIVREVTEGLTKLGETNRQVVSFAEELRNLQDVLQNPKQRGILGEYYLETVLQNVLPPKSFAMQYAFSNGEIVDAVVFVKDRVIPIDSKFSLENYNRLLETRDPAEKTRIEKLFKQDLKNRIDETSKYVRPSEGTMEFAFMFIPSEGVYYDLLVGMVGTGVSARDLVEYAFTKKVIIVSPTSFLAYLQTVMQGLKALQIEESAKEIRKQVEDLGRHILKFEDYYQKIGNTLSTTVNHYNAGYKELGKMDKDVLKMTGERPGVEPELILLPERE